MKRYNLSADFIRWEGDADHYNEVDSFGYVIDLESEEEAQSRLNTLIIERMASKPGWSYKLLNSGYSEFEERDDRIESQSLYEQALSEQSHPGEQIIQDELLLDQPQEISEPDLPQA